MPALASIHPPEIGLLGSSLQALVIVGTNASANREGLTGSIPTEVGLLTGLQSITLGNNRLNGTLPTELAKLQNLILELDLSDNFISGPIPTEFARLSTIEFDFGRNLLNGTLADALTAIGNLTILSLPGNQFTGPIPTAFETLTMLDVFDISENPLSGGLPSELGLMGAATELYVRGCGLSGAIPPEIVDIPGLIILDLSINQFTSFPVGLMGKAGLDLILGNNRFSGPLPTELSTAQSDTILLDHNQFTGPFPPLQSSMLANLDLSHNPLATTLPDWSGLPGSFGRQLFLRNCSLVGPVPAFAPYTNWAVIDFAYNNLYGPLDPFAALTGLTDLDLEHNYFEGSFPAAMANFTSFFKLDVSSNLLSGGLPSLFKSFSLNYLNLHDNNFTGPYPTNFNSVLAPSGLLNVDFSDNNFDNCDQPASQPYITLSCRVTPIGTPPPTLPPTTSPAPTTAAPTPSASATASPSGTAGTTTAPPATTVDTSCVQPPPFENAVCIGGVWYINETIPGTNGTIIIGPTPVVINGTLVLSNGTVLVVSPGGSITVNGTVVLGGTVVIVFSGSQRPEDGEVVPILTATNVTGAVTGIEIEGQPECGTASATPVTTETTFGALISVSGCKSSNKRRTAIIVGCVVAGVALLTIAIVLLLLYLKKTRAAQSLFAQREPMATASYVY